VSHAAIVARAHAREGRRELEDLFPGRWNPRRPLHASLRPAAEAVAAACQAAGWWTPGSGQVVLGGLVVAVDLHGYGPALAFWDTLGAGKTLRPSSFLHSLPSTPAATLGLLFGLTDYQVTFTQAGAGGLLAAAHARDLLRTERRQRLVVAASSHVTLPVAERLHAAGLVEEPAEFRLGVAWCLEAREAVGETEHLPGEPVSQVGDTADLLADLDVGYRVLAAPGLLAAGRALDEGGASTLVHRDSCGGDATLTVARGS
jgi:hypothetical protein